MAEDQEDQYMPKWTKFHIIKNLVLISSAFFLLFTSYDGLSALQSTMNMEGGIGVMSQGVGYIFFGMSSLLLPKYFIRKLGCKSSLIISLMLLLPYIAANFYPKWYTLIPAGALAGIGATVLWGSQSTYFNESAFRYARLITGESASPDNISSDTTADVISKPNFVPEIMEENLINNELSATSKFELIQELKCQKLGCGNVDEFIVSEIAINRVQYKTALEDNNSAKTNEQITTDYLNMNKNSPSKDVSSPSSNQEIEKQYYQEGDNDNSKGLEEVNYRGFNKLDVSKFDKEPETIKTNQPIFKKSNTLESVTGLFFGCHGVAYYFAHISSSAIVYFVLNMDDKSKMIYSFGSNCGAHFCNQNDWYLADDIKFVTTKMRYLLTAICSVTAFIGVLLILFFLDPLKKKNSEEESENKSLDLVLATIYQHMKKEQIYLIPISFYGGMLQSFYTADFTKGYVGCAWGASEIGLVSILYGFVSVISAGVSGVSVKYCGRKPLFLTGQVFSILLFTFLMLWKPDSRIPYMFYIAAVLFGLIVGIIWTQLVAFYGILFRKDQEAAFASYYLWSSMGATASFFLSDHLCMYVKIFTLITLSFIGTIGYLFTERSYQSRKRQEELAST